MKQENNNIVPINEDLDVVEYDINNIKNLIYTIRGKQVMLDSDVAMLYHYETKNINKAMKRNIERFPEDFCFQLTKDELQLMWFHFGTTSEKENIKYRSEKYLPYVYTEQGIAMLSGLLKNEVAIRVSINIMRAFIEMRRFITNNANIFSTIATIQYKLLEYDKKFDEVFNELQKGKEQEFKQQIFFNGQIYDAYSLIIDIIKSAQEKIIIIDSYVDDSILKMLSKKNKNVEVEIVTLPQSRILKLDVKKFNEQYPTLKVMRTSKYHDRFIIIDNKILYHCGASLKDLGKKCFAITKMEDDEYIKKFTD